MFEPGVYHLLETITVKRMFRNPSGGESSGGQRISMDDFELELLVLASDSCQYRMFYSVIFGSLGVMFFINSLAQFVYGSENGIPLSPFTPVW